MCQFQQQELSAQGCRRTLEHLTNNSTKIKSVFCDDGWRDLSVYVHDALDSTSLWWQPMDPKTWLHDLIQIEIVASRHHPLGVESIHRESRHTARFYTNANLSLYTELLQIADVPQNVAQLLQEASIVLNRIIEVWLRFQHQGLTREQTLYDAYKWLVPAGLRNILYLCLYFYDFDNKNDLAVYMAIHVATVGLWTGQTFGRLWLSSSMGLAVYLSHHKINLKMPKVVTPIWDQLERFFSRLGLRANSPCEICRLVTPNRCSQCTIEHYCTATCQRSHWRFHKSWCLVHHQVQKHHLWITTSYRRFFRYLQFIRTTMIGRPRGTDVLCFRETPECRSRMDLNPRLKFFPQDNAGGYCCWNCEKNMYEEAIQIRAQTYSVSYVLPDLRGIFEAMHKIREKQKKEQTDSARWILPLLVERQDHSGGFRWSIYMI